MKTLIKYLYFVIIPIAFISCEKYIDMKIPDKGRKPVVNCMFYNDSVFTVQVFESRFILDESNYEPVNNAIVTIIENETTIDTLHYNYQGYYNKLNFTAQYGKNYKIAVTYNGQTAESYGNIPAKQPITNIDTITIPSQNGDLFRFDIKIDDPANETNYYLLKIAKLNVDYYNNNMQDIWASSSDPSLAEQFHGTFIIKDNLFNGKTKTFPLDIDYNNLYSSNSDSIKFYISLYSISKDFYLYAVTSQAQSNNNGSPFSEPIMVYNNIKNGYGIFAGASVYKDSINIAPRGNGYPIKH